jgi:hypothetical protein
VFLQVPWGQFFKRVFILTGIIHKCFAPVE